MEHARWHAAVATLLPVIEGVVSDQTGILEGVGVGRRLEAMLDGPADSLEIWQGLSAVPALQVVDSELFKHQAFANVAIDQEGLNRHLVLHGRTAAYGTEVNACRTLMVLLALVEIIDGAVVLRATSVAIDEGSLLDEYGPLAPLRAAALRHAA